MAQRLKLVGEGRGAAGFPLILYRVRRAPPISATRAALALAPPMATRCGPTIFEFARCRTAVRHWFDQFTRPKKRTRRSRLGGGVV
jgi:hypothetical protein